MSRMVLINLPSTSLDNGLTKVITKFIDFIVDSLSCGILLWHVFPLVLAFSEARGWCSLTKEYHALLMVSNLQVFDITRRGINIVSRVTNRRTLTLIRLRYTAPKFALFLSNV